MARALVVQHEGSELAFGLSRVERSKLYGTRRRVALDAQERPCSRAALTADGGTLLVSGMSAQGHFAPDGRWVARSEMVGLDAAGNVVDPTPSTLGEPQPLEGPVDPREILQLDLLSVYLLEPEASDSTLVTALKGGKVFRVPFNYATGLTRDTAFLTANDEGLFLLVGRPVEVPWAELTTVFVPDATDDEETDDLDFDQL
jgi:hypothetical protein